MNRLLLWLLSVWAFTTVLKGQTIIPLNLKGIETIKVSSDYAEVEIVQSSDQTGAIEHLARIGNGKQNDFFEITSNQKGTTLSIQAKVSHVDEVTARKVVRNRNGDTLSIEWIDRWEGWRQYQDDQGFQVSIERDIQIILKLMVPPDVEVDVESEYGPVRIEPILNKLVVKTKYAGIEGIWSGGDEPVHLKSTYAFVDLAVPKAKAADVEMFSQYGSFYTDLSLEVTPPTKQDYLVGSIQGGGTPIYLSSRYQNIYLRQVP